MNPDREILWLRRLRDLTQALGTELERPKLIERILDAALELAEADRGFLVLVKPGGGLKIRAARGIGQVELERKDHPSRRVVKRTLSSKEGFATSRETDVVLLQATSLSLRAVTSVVSVPLLLRGSVSGVLYLESSRTEHAFGTDDLPILTTFANQAALALEFVEDLAEPIPEEEHELIGSSLAMDRLRTLISRVATSKELVLITGESGVGKEVVAKRLHALGQAQSSARDRGPFVAESCGAFSETLWESELFGHKKGSFSGAAFDRDGLFVQAGHGTLFLDEVADLSLAQQAKLLRALQEREVRPIGAASPEPIHCRVLASSRESLRELVSSGHFREDLYYRLDVLRVEVPPLRDRLEDLPELVEHFVSKQAGRLRLSQRALELLAAWHWPGNVRELKHELERLHALGVEEVTTPHLPDRLQRSDGLVRTPDLVGKTLGEAEAALVAQALENAQGNKARAARILGISRPSLYRLLDRHGLR